MTTEERMILMEARRFVAQGWTRGQAVRMKEDTEEVFQIPRPSRAPERYNFCASGAIMHASFRLLSNYDAARHMHAKLLRRLEEELRREDRSATLPEFNDACETAVPVLELFDCVLSSGKGDESDDD